jgi:quinol monooxygenase YgiN
MLFVKHIEGRFKDGKREEGIQKVVDFYNALSGRAMGFKGFIMSASLEDPEKAVNISVWETKNAMDQYYANDQEYSVFLESLKPLIEQEIENKDYEVVGFKI